MSDNTDLNDIIDVSVYIAAYNAEKTIVKAIEAARNQAGISVEVIVRDDGSTDNTYEVAKEAGAKMYRNRTNSGVPVTLNKLLPYCTGRYLFNTDADDYIEPDSLPVLVTHADQYAEASRSHKFFVYGDTLYHERDGSTRLHKQTGFTKAAFYKHNPVCSDILVPRESFFEDKIKYTEAEFVHEDWGYMLSLIEQGYLGIPVPTLVLHYHLTPSGNYAQMMGKADAFMKSHFKVRPNG